MSTPANFEFPVRANDDQVELIEDVVSRVMDRIHGGWSLDRSSTSKPLVMSLTPRRPSTPADTAQPRI